MKIIQFLPDTGVGGGQRFVIDLSNELVKNHQVYIVSMYDSEEFGFFEDLDERIKVISLGKKVGFDSSVIFRLFKTIKNIKPDIIHTHLRAFSYLIPLIPFLRKIKFTFTVHNDAFKECPNPKTRKIRKFIFNKFGVMPITISKESTESFKKAYPNTNYHFIYNGRKKIEKSSDFKNAEAEVQNYKKDEQTLVFINIARMEVQKNQIMLAETFKRLIKEENANALLLIVGGARPNEKSKNIEAKLIEIQKECHQIKLLGDKINATDYLYNSDFFCLSSTYEGMPIVLIEAFDLGIVPICTAVGGVTEMVTDIDPLLLSKSTETDDFYQLMKSAYNMQKNKRIELSQKAKNLFSEKYSIEQCTKNHIELYKKLISKTQ